MIRLKHLPLLLLLSAVSCENNCSFASKKVNRAINAVVDTNYVRTGFYFLTDTLNGIKMKLENSGEFFLVDKSAFASVDHIEDNDIQKNKTEQGISKSLYLKFDSEVTKDLAEGTGNPFHSKIAVVIANKLLYVVENNAKIKTGVMNIYVGNYSDQGIQEMQNAIANKKVKFDWEILRSNNETNVYLISLHLLNHHPCCSKSLTSYKLGIAA